MPRRWDEGFGALPLVEDRTAIVSLGLLAAAGGLFVRRWYWPFTVAGAWISLVGATQLWMVQRLGMEAYLERWRVIAPTFVEHDIWSDFRHEFGSTDLLALILAGAALPAAIAAATVVIVRFAARGSGPFDNRAVLASVILGGAFFHGIVEMASVDRLGAALLAIPAALLAGALCRQWRCVLGMPIAFVYGGLVALSIRLLNHGIAADWHQNVVQGIVDGQWSRTHRTLGDDLAAISGTAAYFVLPAGLVGLAASSLAVHVVRSWRRRPCVTA
jgi:hypothetical protein